MLQIINNEIAKNHEILNELENMKLLMKKYRKSGPEFRNEIWDGIVKKNVFIPDEMLGNIKVLADMDIEAAKRIRKDYDPMVMSIWDKMVKDTSWVGYWRNATGIDVEMYVNALIGIIKYKDDAKGRTIEQWFRDNNPKVKQVPYSIKLAEKDYNIFLK